MKKYLLLLLPLLLLAAGCTPQTPTPVQAWSVVKLLSQEEQIESITDVRTVRHCGPIVEQKSISCVAGTSKELSFEIGGSGGVSLGIEVTVDSSIGNALGLNRESGEQLELPVPPDGSMYRYIVTTEYRVLHGEALAVSNAGEESTANYAFQATCSLRIEDVEEQPCQQAVAGNGGEEQPTSMPETPGGGENMPGQESASNVVSQAASLLDEANARYQEGDFAQAVELYGKVLELEPQNAIAYNQRGNAYRQMEQYALCINDYTQAIQYAASPAERATYYANRGAAYALQGDIQRALDDFGQAIAQNPDFARAYESRAALYAQLGNYAQAIADYTTFLNLKPDTPTGFVQRAQAYANAGDLQAAIRDYTQAIALQPMASAYFNRGELYRKLGDPADALADYAQALQLDSSYAPAYLARGLLEYGQNDYEAAVLDLTRAISLGYGNFDAYLHRGLAYLQREEGEAAVSDFTQALSLSPDYADLYFYRAQSYLLTGERQAAIEDLTAFLQAAPPDSPLLPEAQKLLKALQEQKPPEGGEGLVAPTIPSDPNQ